MILFHTEMMDKLYNAAKCPKEKITIAGADHAKMGSSGSSVILGWNSIRDFIEKHA